MPVTTRAATLMFGGLLELSVALLGESETESLLFVALGLPPKLPNETHAAWRIRTKVGTLR